MTKEENVIRKNVTIKISVWKKYILPYMKKNLLTKTSETVESMARRIHELEKINDK